MDNEAGGLSINSQSKTDDANIQSVSPPTCILYLN